jgi:hypothetical protein
MILGTNKLTEVKGAFSGLSTRAKIFVTAGSLSVVVGVISVGVLVSGNNNPNLATMTSSSDSNKQNNTNSNAVLAETDDNASSQTDNGQNTDTDQQVQQNSNQRTSTQGTHSTNQSGGSTPQPQPSAPKPDYNLNENWYFTASSGTGPVNTCWPEPFTAENESRCMGANMDFVGIGVAKTAQASGNAATDQLNQNAAAAHVELRKGGALEPALLTEALCTQYSLSCGRW